MECGEERGFGAVSLNPCVKKAMGEPPAIGIALKLADEVAVSRRRPGRNDGDVQWDKWEAALLVEVGQPFLPQPRDEFALSSLPFPKHIARVDALDVELKAVLGPELHPTFDQHLHPLLG